MLHLVERNSYCHIWYIEKLFPHLAGEKEKLHIHKLVPPKSREPPPTAAKVSPLESAIHPRPHPHPYPDHPDLHH